MKIVLILVLVCAAQAEDVRQEYLNALAKYGKGLQSLSPVGCENWKTFKWICYLQEYSMIMITKSSLSYLFYQKSAKAHFQSFVKFNKGVKKNNADPESTYTATNNMFSIEVTVKKMSMGVEWGMNSGEICFKGDK